MYTSEFKKKLSAAFRAGKFTPFKQLQLQRDFNRHVRLNGHKNTHMSEYDMSHTFPLRGGFNWKAMLAAIAVAVGGTVQVNGATQSGIVESVLTSKTQPIAKQVNEITPSATTAVNFSSAPPLSLTNNVQSELKLQISNTTALNKLQEKKIVVIVQSIQDIQKTNESTTNELIQVNEHIVNTTNEIQTIQQNQTKLNETEAELSNTGTELSNTGTELSNTKIKLSNTEIKLSKTEIKLSKTEIKLNETGDELSQQGKRLENEQNQINQLLQFISLITIIGQLIITIKQLKKNIEIKNTKLKLKIQRMQKNTTDTITPIIFEKLVKITNNDI